jgi:hypothetical protein
VHGSSKVEFPVLGGLRRGHRPSLRAWRRGWRQQRTVWTLRSARRTQNAEDDTARETSASLQYLSLETITPPKITLKLGVACARRARERRLLRTAGKSFFWYKSLVTKRSELGTPSFQHALR